METAVLDQLKHLVSSITPRKLSLFGRYLKELAALNPTDDYDSIDIKTRRKALSTLPYLDNPVFDNDLPDVYLTFDELSIAILEQVYAVKSQVEKVVNLKNAFIDEMRINWLGIEKKGRRRELAEEYTPFLDNWSDLADILRETTSNLAQYLPVRDEMRPLVSVFQLLEDIMGIWCDINPAEVIARFDQYFGRPLKMPIADNTPSSTADTSTSQPEEPTKPATQPEPGAKLKWNCNPATAGFLISTLVRAGYIEPPFRKNEEVNRTELARICMQLFDFISDTPSVDTWRKNLDIDSSTGNQFSNDNREKFAIPHLTKLNKSNSSTVRTLNG